MAELIDLIDDVLSQATDKNEKEAPQQLEEDQGEEQVEEEKVVEKAPKVKAEAKEKDPRKPRSKKVPKMEDHFQKQPTTMEEWLLGHSLFPNAFTYTPEGDLQVPAIFTGDVSRVIPVTRFQPATLDHMKSFYDTRKVEAKEKEDIYVEAKRDLHKIVLLYKRDEASIDEVLNANRKVAIAERDLNAVLKDPRSIYYVSRVEKKSITMVHEDKGTIRDPVLVTKYTTFPLQSFWMPAPEPEVVAPQPLPIRQTEENSNSNSNSNNTPVPPKKPLTAQQIAIIRAKMGKK